VTQGKTSRGSRDGLSPEDLEAWHRLTATVGRRLVDNNHAIIKDSEISKEETSTQATGFVSEDQAGKSRARITETRIPTEKRKADSRKAPLVAPLSERLAGLDRRTARRLKQGRSTPDARLDLHGYTKAEAHQELVPFICRAQDRGCRWVLVITGKGKKPRDDEPFWEHENNGRGVLRRMVPLWLRQPPLNAIVTNVIAGGPAFGGDGALIVYLRKR
jgi:DNA-nicking Smr family endonuclease